MNPVTPKPTHISCTSLPRCSPRMESTGTSAESGSSFVMVTGPGGVSSGSNEGGIRIEEYLWGAEAFQDPNAPSVIGRMTPGLLAGMQEFGSCGPVAMINAILAKVAKHDPRNQCVTQPYVEELSSRVLAHTKSWAGSGGITPGAVGMGLMKTLHELGADPLLRVAINSSNDFFHRHVSSSDGFRITSTSPGALKKPENDLVAIIGWGQHSLPGIMHHHFTAAHAIDLGSQLLVTIDPMGFGDIHNRIHLFTFEELARQQRGQIILHEIHFTRGKTMYGIAELLREVLHRPSFRTSEAPFKRHLPHPNPSRPLNPLLKLRGNANLHRIRSTLLRTHAQKLEDIFIHIADTYYATRSAAGFPLSGKRGNVVFSASLPPLRTGKHAFVALVKATIEGQTLEFAIRQNTQDAQEHLRAVQEKPEIAQYVPQLYGIIGNFAVIEKINGLELQEITSRLQHDEAFTQLYAQLAWQLLLKSSSEQLILNDVAFGSGHNCMFNEGQNHVRLVEQDNLAHAPDYNPEELVMLQLLTELHHHNAAEFESAQLNFLFELMQLAFASRTAESYFIRPRRIRFGHPEFKRTFLAQRFPRRSPFQQALWSGNPTKVDALFEQNFSDRTARARLTASSGPHHHTQIFSAEFIQSVFGQNRTLFNRLVHERKAALSLCNEGDPRSRPIFVKP